MKTAVVDRGGGGGGIEITPHPVKEIGIKNKVFEHGCFSVADPGVGEVDG